MFEVKAFLSCFQIAFLKGNVYVSCFPQFNFFFMSNTCCLQSYRESFASIGSHQRTQIYTTTRRKGFVFERTFDISTTFVDFNSAETSMY